MRLDSLIKHKAKKCYRKNIESDADVIKPHDLILVNNDDTIKTPCKKGK